MSSIAPDTASELAAAAADVGTHWLDAPVSGGEAGAVAGTLSIMVGGDQDVFERCRAVLATMGSSVIRVGNAGAGQVAKACNQVVVGCAIAAVAEALVLAAASGVDPAVVREVLLGGLAQSKVLDVHGDRMLRQDFAPGFRTALHRKDLVNALAAGRAAGSPLPMAATVAELMTAAIAGGGGDLDHAAVVRAYEALAARPLGGCRG